MSQGPRISIDSIDFGPDDLTAQLPIHARLLRQIPGPDRPDYFLLAAETPLYHHTTIASLREQGIDPAAADPKMIRVHDDGSVDLQVFGLVIAARVVGERPYAGMQGFPVALAYVVDNTLMRDEKLDFSKALYAAVAFITDRTPQGSEDASRQSQSQS